MADKESRTEEATDKKKSDARAEGQIARSQDVAPWLSLLVGITILQQTAVKGGRFLIEEMNEAAELIAHPDANLALKFFISSVTDAMIIVAPLALCFAVISIIGHFIQVRFVLAWKALKPNFKRLNPIQGFKRLFSPATYFQAGKDLAKTLVLGVIAYQTLWATIVNFSSNGPFSISMLIAVTATAVMNFIKFVAVAGLAIAFLDYLYQRYNTKKQMRMSKDEVKQEGKQQEGSPEVKGKIRQKQQAMSRNRMMTVMKDADVVVVNPVHVAVALKYDKQKGAPRVVAKGAGFVAEKIREQAEEHGIPLVQDIPLARTLHSSCEIDDEVPVELFEAVARMLAFVFGLRNRGTADGFHKMPGTPELEEYEREEARKKAEAEGNNGKPTSILDLVGA